ncbi:MAG: hypothetical protein MPJ24_02615 [Pirellulaceae bacterium]|nr:hypothetical protein [Pirellulaceae bacterium]
MNQPTDEILLPPNFLFRFGADVKPFSGKWGKNGVTLGESFVLPNFSHLEGRTEYAQLELGWSEEGLAFHTKVTGKEKSLWCRESRLDESDGLFIWIDTRGAQNIHRASRYCHQFAFLPAGGGTLHKEPLARWVPIHRAKEDPKMITNGELKLVAKVTKTGYSLTGMIPSNMLTGYDPDQFSSIGFMYALVDSEKGWQTFGNGPEFPIKENPTLWGTLNLVLDE